MKCLRLDPALQANKTRLPLMDAGRRHENPGSEKKDFKTCGTANSMSFMFAQFPFPSKFHGVMQSGSGGCCICSGFVSLLSGTPSLGDTKLLKRAVSKPVQPLSSRKTYLYYSGQQTNLPFTLKGNLICHLKLFTMSCQHP